MSDVVLSVEDLAVQYPTEDGPARAVDGASFDVREGEVLAVLGETGAGKSTTASGVVRLLEGGDIVGGEVTFGDATLVGFEEADGSPVPRDGMLTKGEMRSQVRGNGIAFVPADPSGSLNPTYPVGDQVREFVARNRDLSGDEAREEAVEMLRAAGVSQPEKRYHDYPRDLPEGTCLRALVAMAFGCRPDLVVADDPTAAVDVTVQRSVLDLVQDLSDEYGTSILWTTDDPGVAAVVADQVGVMHLGRIVERGPVEAVFHDPDDPYTEALIASTPRADASVERLDPVAVEASDDHEAFEDGQPITDDGDGQSASTGGSGGVESTGSTVGSSPVAGGDGSPSGTGEADSTTGNGTSTEGVENGTGDGSDDHPGDEAPDGREASGDGIGRSGIDDIGDDEIEELIEEGEKSVDDLDDGEEGGGEIEQLLREDEEGEEDGETRAPDEEEFGPKAETQPKAESQPEIETEPDTRSDSGSRPETQPEEGSSGPDLGEQADEPVDSIKGIGPTYADRLGEAGIETVSDLVADDVETVAATAEVSESRAEDWFDRAPVEPPEEDEPDLGEAGDEPVDTVRGVGPTYADRLGEAGIVTVADLVTSESSSVAAAAEVSESRVERWVDSAPVDPPGEDGRRGGENDD